jgi:hypothetical protein
MEGYIQWPKQEETKERWTELFGVVESSLGDLERRVAVLESTETDTVEPDVADPADPCEELKESLQSVDDRIQMVRCELAERAVFLLQGIVNANQGSSEWCLGYLKRAVKSGLITRDYAEHLLFGIVRVSGYWRDRFDEMFPEEG